MDDVDVKELPLCETDDAPVGGIFVAIAVEEEEEGE